MAPSELHIIGVDPGETTGLCHMIVPRKCFFGNQPSEIIDWSVDEVYGTEEKQAIAIARWVVQVQSLDYLVGPAVVVEDFDIMIRNPSTDPVVLTPVRIAAMLRMMRAIGRMGDARIVLQGRTIAKETMPDERLKRFGYYTPGLDHMRDATRHALTALRRATVSDEFRDELWNADICDI